MNRKGFTLVELVIVIIIIGIISIVAAPIIKNYNEERQNTIKRNNLFNKQAINEGMYYYNKTKHCKVKIFSNINDFDLESDINRFCEGKTVIDIKINTDEKAIHATIIYKEK